MVKCIQCLLAHMGGFCHHILDASCVFAGMGVVWSSHFEMYVMFSLACVGLVNIIYMHFVCSLAWYWFEQPTFRCILCTSWRRMGFFNTYCFLAGMEGVWSRHDEM